MGAFDSRVAVVTGENICVDGGMTRLMIYHGDHSWEYRAGGDGSR